MSRGKRTRIGLGIYRDTSGVAATVKVKSLPQREKRFPLETEIDTIKAWQADTRSAILKQLPTASQRTRTRDPFHRAVVRYLRQIKGRPGAAAERAHLAAWVAVFHGRPRHGITGEDVRLAFATWRSDGNRRVTGKRPAAPQTLRHRYRALKQLYRVLDGPKAPTPCDEVPRPAVPKSVPRDVPLATIRSVLGKIRFRYPLDYARLYVLATTSKRPCELMRTTRADLDLPRRLWTIRPAKGGEPQQVHLNSEMLTAWKRLLKLNGLGVYDTTQYARRLRRCGWPSGIRPYNVRHALAIELLRRGADLSDVQVHLGHASIDTTRTFYAGIVTERQKSTSRLLEQRFSRK